MALILTVLQIVAPVFILAAIGFTWVKLGYDYSVEFVTRLSMTISVPCLIFVALMQADISGGDLSKVILATLLTYAAVTLAMLVLVKAMRLSVQTFWAPMIFGNTGNLGLPLALFAFGQVGLDYAVIVFALMAIYSFSIGIWMVSGTGGIKRMTQEPIVWGSVAGAIFLLMGWQTPEWMTNTIGLIGQMAIPLMLITLGVALARLKPNALVQSAFLSAAKVIICAGLALAIGMWMGLDKTALAILILQISAPVAVTNYLLAQKYGAKAEEVAGLVVVSTALSILYLPLLLAFVI